MKLLAETMIQEITKTVHLDYLLSLPKAARGSNTDKWPLILFLHGAGERGANLNQLFAHGIPRVVSEMDDFPFITVSPQCPQDSWWNNQIDALDTLFIQVITRYPVDLERIYLTGISMGGYGVWTWASLYPERFAAVAPICGGGAPFHGFPDKVRSLKNTPVWTFHGAKDEIIPARETQVLVDTLKACGGNVQFTLYPDAPHDCWTETYQNPRLYAWFLEHQHILA